MHWFKISDQIRDNKKQTLLILKFVENGAVLCSKQTCVQHFNSGDSLSLKFY